MRTLCDGKQGEVQGLSEALSSLSSELRDVQDQLKAKGDRVSDTSPVQELRAATKRLRDDNVSLELRIGESLRLSVPAATACGDSNQTNESNESNETYTTNQSALCVCVCVCVYVCISVYCCARSEIVLFPRCGIDSADEKTCRSIGGWQSRGHSR